jgi:hypothetical protein
MYFYFLYIIKNNSLINMYNDQINDILLINKYLTIKKIEDPKSDHFLIVKKYLEQKINKALEIRSNTNSYSLK